MSRNITPGKALNDLVEDARALMDATADVAEQKVAKARKRLASALERGRSNGEAFMDRSSDVVKEDFKQVHKIVSDAWDHGMEICGDARDKAVEKAKSADAVVRENPYRAIGIALGVGALVGFITSFRHSRNGK